MSKRIQRALPAALVLGLALALSEAQAAETYDLTKLLVREPAAGGKAVREVSSESERGRQVVRQKGKVLQDQSANKSSSYARKVEVLEATPAGDPTKTRYVYESYQRQQGETEQVLEVAGLAVLVDETRPNQPAKITPEGGRQVPPFLENKLQDEAQQPPRSERIKKLGLLLPGEPVQVGQVWKKSGAAAAKALDLSEEGLEAKASSLSGKIQPGAKEGTLAVTIQVTLTYRRYQGMRCLEPVVVKVELVTEVPTQDGDPTGSMTQTMAMTGTLETPQGLEVEIQVDNETKTAITYAKP